MKAFTDIKQSKKLAEILPIDSADMVYIDAGYCSRVLPSNDIDANSYPTICPCWSTAALLDISPYIEVGRELYGAHHGKWYSRYTTGDYQYKTIADNLVDACYETILKLNKQI